MKKTAGEKRPLDSMSAAEKPPNPLAPHVYNLTELSTRRSSYPADIAVELPADEPFPDLQLHAPPSKTSVGAFFPSQQTAVDYNALANDRSSSILDNTMVAADFTVLMATLQQVQQSGWANCGQSGPPSCVSHSDPKNGIQIGDSSIDLNVACTSDELQELQISATLPPTDCSALLQEISQFDVGSNYLTDSSFGRHELTCEDIQQPFSVAECMSSSVVQCSDSTIQQAAVPPDRPLSARTSSDILQPTLSFLRHRIHFDSLITVSGPSKPDVEVAYGPPKMPHSQDSNSCKISLGK